MSQKILEAEEPGGKREKMNTFEECQRKKTTMENSEEDNEGIKGQKGLKLKREKNKIPYEII